MAKYEVWFDFNVSGNVQIEAESKSEAEKIVRKQINFNLGELESNDTLTDHECAGVHACIVKEYTV